MMSRIVLRCVSDIRQTHTTSQFEASDSDAVRHCQPVVSSEQLVLLPSAAATGHGQRPEEVRLDQVLVEPGQA
ncbi:hypothetical protein WJX79_000341 [Trebouxia sp. C0005]